MDAKLYTTLEEFEALHAAHDKTRRTSKTVTVPREALIHMLMDHSAFVAEKAPRLIGARQQDEAIATI